MSENKELGLHFLPWLVSQSEVGTSLGQGDECLGHGWQVLFTAGLGAHAKDVLCLNPWTSGFTQPSIYPRYP